VKAFSAWRRLYAPLIFCLALPAAGSAWAASGLAWRLETPPSWVSTYQLPPDRKSVALADPIYPRLSFDLERKTANTESFYEEKTLRFQQSYYRRGSEQKSLTPVAVDALSYNAFRREQLVHERRDEIAKRQMEQARANRGQGGLGVKINLPKRLDRIFGEGGAGLRVSGYRRISFAGRSQWTDAKGVSIKQSKFPSLNMEQQYQFDITGTIGSKITVKVSQDSHTELPLSNNIMIRYKGDEDDVLKTIEAGNTNLSLPNTQFVGYSSQIRGLFGVKAEAQVGRLYLTGIASQEKGSSERTTVTPTGEESAQIIRDSEYAQRRIFDIGLPGEFQPGDEITRLLVYRKLETWQKERPANAAYATLEVFPDSTSASARYSTERVDLTAIDAGVIPVEDGEFEWFSKPDSNRHYLVFLQQPRDLSIGVYLEVKRAGGAVDTIGSNTDGTFENPKRLKLLFNENSMPSFKTWGLMWRNCYALPMGTNIDDIDVKIYKGLAATENTSTPKDYQETPAGTQSYIEILGLDQYSRSNQLKQPDGKIDDRPEVFRAYDWGLLIFPHREPFNSDTTFTDAQGSTTQPLDLKVPNLYYYDGDIQRTNASQYFLKLFTKSRSSEIRLGRANIIEGSERITANGVQLVRGEDYRIDYDFGRVTLISEQARDPNADVAIDFEYAPFLSVQKKTLLGFRAEYEVSRDLKIGSTVLYKSDKARDRKPRVGEETAKSYVFDADATWSLRPNFLTRLADALPIVQTESPSNLRLQAEVAQSRPNPNVDGEAYVDDFEASAEQMTLGTARTQWTLSSAPAHPFTGEGERGRLLWHNPDRLLRFDQVYNRETAAGESTFRSLRLIFRPNVVDSVWAEEPDTGQTVWTPPDTSKDLTYDSWAGIMRYFANRVDNDRVQVFEIRARGRSGRMHVEFGRISEDVDGDGKAYTEDRPPTGEFLPEEDIGLDGLPDELEPHYHPLFNPDPNRDNWFLEDEGECPLPTCSGLDWNNDSLRYEWLNGTEGNRVELENLNRPDAEILGDVSGLEKQNGYFSYVIDFSAPADTALDTTKTKYFRDLSSYKVSADESEGGGINPPWYTYRIPIRDPEFLDRIVIDEDGDSAALAPAWTGERIRHVRIWFEQMPGQTWTDTVEIADWYFVQSYWRDTVIYGAEETGSQLVAATISEEDGRFRPPPGVEPYTDPTTNVTEPQRGMMLEFSNLDSRDTLEVRKSVLQVDKYAGYRRLRMYVYGRLQDPGDYNNVLFFFRVGRDSLNYYEQRRVLREGWDPENFVDIDFNEITAIKDAAQRGREPQEWAAVDTVTPDGRQRIRGDPSLNEVKYFVAGIVNSDPSRLPSGEIWLDELRVSDVRKDVGTAVRFAANGNVADLGSYSFTYQTQDPYFRGLSSSTRGGSDQNLGSGSSDTRVMYSFSLNADQFVPRSWNARLPVTYSYSKSTQLPLLRTGSDIVLPEEVRRQEQVVSESQMISVSGQVNKAGRNPLFTLLLNRLQGTSFSYRRSLQQSPRVPYGLTEGYSVRSGFDFGLKKPLAVAPLRWTESVPIVKRLAGTAVGLYPSRWTLSGGFDRTLTITDDIEGKRRTSFQRSLDAKMDFAYELLQNLDLSFRANTRRDLSDPKDVNLSLSHLRLGRETHFDQQATAKYTPALVSWLSTDFGFSGSYADDLERSSGARRSTMSSSWNLTGRFDHMRFLGGKGGEDERRYRGKGGISGGRSDRGSKTEGEVKAGRPFYDPPLAVLRFLTGWIDAPSYNYSETFRYALPGSVERPGLKYRLGLSRTPGVAQTAGSTNPSASEGVSYDFGSGFTLLGGLQTTVKYRQGITRDLVKKGDLYEDISTSWPDLTIQIRPFTTLPLIKKPVNKFIDIFSPRTSYSRSTRERRDLGGDFVISRSTSTSQSPLLSLNFKLFKALSLTTSYSLSNEESDEYNRTTGAYTGGSEAIRKTIGGSAQYSFAAPSGISLPLFGKVKFRSTVNISLDIKFNNSVNRTFDAKGNVNNITENDEMEIRPDISYTFSQQIKGGLSMRWRDSNVSNQKTHLREVQIWMEIRF